MLYFQDEVYLNLVLDLVPENLYRLARNYGKAKVKKYLFIQFLTKLFSK